MRIKNRISLFEEKIDTYRILPEVAAMTGKEMDAYFLGLGLPSTQTMYERLAPLRAQETSRTLNFTWRLSAWSLVSRSIAVMTFPTRQVVATVLILFFLFAPLFCKFARFHGVQTKPVQTDYRSVGFSEVKMVLDSSLRNTHQPI